MTDLASRYGAKKRRSKALPIVSVVLLVIAVAWVAWVALDKQPVSAHVYGYDVKDAHTVVVTLDVTTPKPRKVVCDVYAQADDHSIVGEKSVNLAPRSGTHREQITIETERKAVTGVLRTCQLRH